jgi:hypothetical protein
MDEGINCKSLQKDIWPSEVFMAAKIDIVVFSVKTSLVGRYHHFGRTCCFYHQDRNEPS